MLGTVAHVLVQDHEVHTTEFHQLPYHRFFIMLLTDLTTSDPVFEAIIFPVLQAFGYVLCCTDLGSHQIQIKFGLKIINHGGPLYQSQIQLQYMFIL